MIIRVPPAKLPFDGLTAVIITTACVVITFIEQNSSAAIKIIESSEQIETTYSDRLVGAILVLFLLS
jgi:hypothetical protein